MHFPCFLIHHQHHQQQALCGIKFNGHSFQLIICFNYFFSFHLHAVRISHGFIQTTMNAMTEAMYWVPSHMKQECPSVGTITCSIRQNILACANNTTKIKSWTMSIVTWNSIQLMIEREMPAEFLRNITHIKPIMASMRIRGEIMPTMDLVRM